MWLAEGRTCCQGTGRQQIDIMQVAPPMQEVALLGRIEVAAEDLLARCLENYYALSEAALGE